MIVIKQSFKNKNKRLVLVLWMILVVLEDDDAARDDDSEEINTFGTRRGGDKDASYY